MSGDGDVNEATVTEMADIPTAAQLNWDPSTRDAKKKHQTSWRSDIQLPMARCK